MRTERDRSAESSARCSLLLSLALSAMVGTAPVSAQPDAGTRARVRSYDLAGKATLFVSTPSEWKEEVRNVGTAFPTIVLTPSTGSSFQLLLTPIPNLVGPSATDSDKLRAVVKEGAQSLLATSVEKEAKLVELKGKEVFGYRYTLTDKAPKVGGFPFVTAGGLHAGDFLVQFTLLHREPDVSPTAPLEAVRSLEIKSVQPDAEEKARSLLESKERWLPIYLRACEHDEGLACGLATDLLRRDADGMRQAFSLASKGCDLGSSYACEHLAVFYWKGAGTEKDEAAAVGYFRAACDAGGNGRACFQLAKITRDGLDGSAKDEKKSDDLIVHACDLGNHDACDSYLKKVGAPAETEKEAYCKFFSAKCEANPSLLCGYAGWCAETGYAGKKDPKSAKRFYERGCAAKSIGACFHRSRLEPDSDRTISAYRKSCQQGHGEACVKLVKALVATKHDDLNETVNALRRSCNGDSADGCMRMLLFWEKMYPADRGTSAKDGGR